MEWHVKTTKTLIFSSLEVGLISRYIEENSQITKIERSHTLNK